MRLCFVSAIGGSAFMHELLAVVADEVAQLGVETSLHEGAFPEFSGDEVYVVVPHEYFVVTPAEQHPTREQRDRTIAFAVEHPGNETFEVSARWCREVAAVFDINDDSRRELERRGIDSERFVLGYSRRWDHWHGVADERTVDVTYLGTTEPRRAQALASYGEALAPWNVCLLMPPHEPMVRPRPDFLMGEAKFRHLANSKMLLNLHRGDSWSLEWVRVLEAMCNGCVIVSEHSPDFAPLVPGEHIVLGNARSLGDLALQLLRSPERAEGIRTSAYEFIQSTMSMREHATSLVDVATSLQSGSRRRTAMSMRGERAALPRPRTTARWTTTGPSPRTSVPASVVSSVRALFELVPRAESPDGRALEATLDCIVAGTRPYQSSFDAVHALGNQVRADARGRILYWTTGPAPGSGDVASAPVEPAECVGRGHVLRASALNRMLARSGAEFVLVVDPEVRLFEGAADRLVQALRVAPDAAAAYPMLRDWDGTITNSLPFEDERIHRLDYLGSTALWRRSALTALAGWNEDRAVSGHEDHELWCRLAKDGGTAVLVPQVLGRRSLVPIPPIEARDIDPWGTWQLAVGEAART